MPSLEETLKQRIRGEVRFDAGSRALYAADASNYRQVPIGVVIPKSREDIRETVAACRQFGAPILSRGGGTSLAGQCCNAAVVMDMTKYYNRILELDIPGRRARVEPGLVLDELQEAAAKHDLRFGPDPSTHNHCTFGGMIGNNSCGSHSLQTGVTLHNVDSLTILTYDGLELTVGPTSDDDYARILSHNDRVAGIYRSLRELRDAYADEIRRRFPKLERRVSGLAIDQLLPENGFNVARALVGTEGTCVTVLEATVRLTPKPKKVSLMVLGFRDIYEAADHVPDVLPFKPDALEGMDDQLVQDIRIQLGEDVEHADLPAGGGWLLVEFGGATKAEADAKALATLKGLQAAGLRPTSKVIDDAKEEKHIWKIRESGLGATAFLPGTPDTWEGWEDSTVPPKHLGAYLRDLRKIYKKHGYQGAFYGHFGGGCLHTRINFDLVSPIGIRNYRAFIDEAADAVVRYGGSFSGEHGDGQSKAVLLPKMFGDTLVRAFGEFKAIWDPENKMNPGKVVHPYKPTENLRLGPNYQPADPETHFRYPKDNFTFSRAALRCVGIGECRKHGEGTMCPSYMVTREEMHSTRGRTHLLFEMLRGETITGGWRDPHVKEALDLCLSCKGCRGECPTKVDVATYKSEFLSHYYKGKLHPLRHYAIGGIYWLARLASLAPRIANFFSQSPFFSAIGKRVFDIAPQRKIPPFAVETFRHAFDRQRDARLRSDRQVLLWADTFNNHFHPKVALAAVKVLEDAGYEVLLPKANLCCGRPLYDYGMLTTAKRLLRETLDGLRPQIRAGIPVIGLEPSCISVFRDEVINLFPNDQDAIRLHNQTFMLSEFLYSEAKHYTPPPLEGRVLLHGHCHHKAVLKFNAQVEFLKRMGLEIDDPQAGCCGMAGGFGFEADHYDVSVAAGERVLMPAVRSAAPTTWIVTSGFSCHEQILQQAHREALHFAEIVAEAIDRRGIRKEIKESLNAYAGKETVGHR